MPGVAFASFLFAMLSSSLWLDGIRALNLNWVIGSLWLCALLAFPTPERFARYFADALRESAGILQQFPIYFATLGIVGAAGWLSQDGLAWPLVNLMQNRDGTLAHELTYLLAAGLNLVVPSGGGQWVLQAPVLEATISATGIAPGKLILAFCYGDQITNLLQPFWAIPVLAITGVKARDLFLETWKFALCGFLVLLVSVVLM